MRRISLKIKAYPVIKDYITIEVPEGYKIIDLIKKLSEEYEDFNELFLDEKNELDIDVVLILNDVTTKDLNVKLRNGDKLIIIPPVAGGYCR